MKTAMIVLLALVAIFIVSYYLAKWHTKTYDDPFL